MSEQKIETRALYVELTPDEVQIRRDETLAAERVFDEHEERLSKATEAWKATRKNLENDLAEARQKLRMLGRIAREGREIRDVEVEIVPNNARKVMDTVRKDTGEIVESRGMDANEMQRSFFDMKRVRDLPAGDRD